MPALQYHLLQKRIESGTTFSIVFGVVAAVVIVACAVWGIALPQYRRNRPRTPLTAKWSTRSGLATRERSNLRRTYPNHPAIRPLLSKPLAARTLPTYNPRVESPFQDGPALHMVSFCKTRANSTPDPLTTSVSSNGLFTPLKRSDSKNDESKNKFHTVPRANDAKHLTIPSSDFGDAKDFILAVPEPLALRPREAGRPPAVIRHLDRYGTPHTASSIHSDKLLHPNKLFRAVQKSDSRNSFCSSTSMRLDHRKSDAANNLHSKDVIEANEQAIKEDNDESTYKSDKDKGSIKEASTSAAGNVIDSQDHDRAIVHRLRSYNSLTGGQVPKPTRAGTLTRPKTPVDELRRLYARGQRNFTEPSIRLPYTGTVSTLLTNTEVGSEAGSISTPATSPAFPPTSSSLLPQPLHLKRSFEPGSVRDSGISQPYTIGSTIFGEGSSNDAASIEADDQKRDGKSDRGFYHTGRRLTKPPPLNINHHTKILPLDSSHSRQSFTEFSNAVFGPLIKSNGMRSRARASSMYSRDTHGVSMVNTPITPDFPTPASEVFTDRVVSGNPFKPQESVKSRIDEWTQRIEGSTMPPLPPIRHVSPILKPSQTFAEDMSEKGEAKKTTTAGPLIHNENPFMQDDLREENGAPGGAVWI